MGSRKYNLRLMAKKYRLRPTGRKYARPVRALQITNPYRARPGLNTYSSARSRYFNPLPKMMQLKSSWYADSKYSIPFANTGTFVAGGTACAYWFIDPLNMANPTSTYGTGTGGKYFYSPDLGGFLALYQEARFRTHVLNINVSGELESQFGPDITNQAIFNNKHTTVLHVAITQVPLAYLKKADNSAHVIGEAGQVFQQVDYYTSLSQQPGVKQMVIPIDGSLNSIKSARIEIDAFDHNSVAQIIRSSQTWAAPADNPTVAVTYPDPATRNVFLVACRVGGLPTNSKTNILYVRTEMKLDQHLTFTDKFPSFPYVTDAVV